ncbi:MAG: bifunctional metallophosphatase/5'-nucleotidase [Vibrio sp.]|uniref:Bifunctional UDP-sugar hydrolase/5'-nucleotidase n=1 Tax=Vibrio chanodichtyis TaxID=3027932 RepID=A0ABT5V3K9_9VIBR|nr:bifunctional UDP-sugar hydrolase/5'-nucleotidase [Vibrio chanodichtyis]MDE1515383.1 bifunctional UDP-sugar hydrolase/5'-nucleotidase [Vibrio chanodichtyis]
MPIRISHQPASITLAHINDTHSYFEPTSLQLTLEHQTEILKPFVSAGGFARIATRVAQLRDDAQRMQRGFLFLHAGDCFQGTLYFSLFKGQANADMLNALNLDAMVVGNHELDLGNQPVAEFAQQIQFPLLAGNWDLSQERANKAPSLANNPKIYSYDAQQGHARWIEKSVNGENIAIFGLSIDKMADIANPDPDTPFVNALATAKATVAAIHQQGINKIILLSHLGYDGDIALAEQVDGISVIVGGHSHVLQGDFSALGIASQDHYGRRVNQTYIVQAGFYALMLGHCQIDFAADGQVTRFTGRNELLLGRRMFVDASMSQVQLDENYRQARDQVDNHPNVVVCKKDLTLQALLQDKYVAKVRQLQQQIIAHADHGLRHIRIPDAQGGSQIAPLVAKAFAHALNKRGLDVQFAIHNAGGVRNSILPGAISVADVAGKLLPFAVPIGVYQVSGRVIAQVLEGAINNALSNGVVGTGSGSYPYCDRLRFQYIADNPLGERITKLQIQQADKWQPIDFNLMYWGTSSAYTMKGKEGYDALLAMEGEGIVTQISMADAFIELLTDCPTLLSLDSNTIYECPLQ